MARPRGPADLRKTEQMIIRMTRREKRNIERAAKRDRLSLSEYGRKHIPELASA